MHLDITEVEKSVSVSANRYPSHRPDFVAEMALFRIIPEDEATDHEISRCVEMAVDAGRSCASAIAVYAARKMFNITVS